MCVFLLFFFVLCFSDRNELQLEVPVCNLVDARKASWRRAFDPCAPLLFILYHYLEQNVHFGFVPEHASCPSSEVLPCCRVRHSCYSKKLFVRLCDSTLTANPTCVDIFDCCFKAQSSKLERLFWHVSVKRDVQSLRGWLKQSKKEPARAALYGPGRDALRWYGRLEVTSRAEDDVIGVQRC